METIWTTVAQHISDATGTPFMARSRQAVGGGCINRATVLEDGKRRYFVKLNDAIRFGMFEAEAEGLKDIARTRSVRVPEPVCWGMAEVPHLSCWNFSIWEAPIRAQSETVATGAMHRARMIDSAGAWTTPSARHRRSTHPLPTGSSSGVIVAWASS
jgi:hypothetical protein